MQARESYVFGICSFHSERDLHSEIVPKNTAHSAPCHAMPPTSPPATSGVPQPGPDYLEGGASPLSVAKKRENGCLILNLNPTERASRKKWAKKSSGGLTLHWDNVRGESTKTGEVGLARLKFHQ